ncbi:fasciclin domain-containing protein [Frankia sp. CiP1_Cm_nod1]|uniref:fasciclin domain-containing protein n=1 Tax=Frankia sp. CiP1_Cm_nod1 TaxID=2897160 RepID=UPI002025AA99
MTAFTRITRCVTAAAAVVILPLALTACGGDDTPTDSAASAPASSAAALPTAPGESVMAQPFGAACSAVPTSGAGSFSGMASDPVATAASHNPVLSTLVTAVEKAGLVDTLNNAQGITVFAPTNDAFAKIPTAQLNAILNDKAMLTKILTYHVVGQKAAPADLVNGSFATLEKGRLTTSGSGESFKVNDTANVVCGNVQTANATVYIIDSVLTPTS